MRKSDKNICKQIEEMLINQEIDAISEEDRQILIKHLNTCEHCKAKQLVVDEIQNILNIERNRELNSNPETRENLLARFKANQPGKIAVLGNLLNFLKSFFSYRIPVYQAVVGLISVFLIIFALQKFPSKSQEKIPRQIIMDQKSAPFLSQINILDSLKIISSQKIGLNVREDTVFTKYIHTTM